MRRGYDGSCDTVATILFKSILLKIRMDLLHEQPDRGREIAGEFRREITPGTDEEVPSRDDSPNIVLIRSAAKVAYLSRKNAADPEDRTSVNTPFGVYRDPPDRSGRSILF